MQVRITNGQIVILEKIIVESKLSLEGFEKARSDESVTFQYKTNYFSFVLTKRDQDSYTVAIKSIYSTEAKVYSTSWDNAGNSFKAWCEQISYEVKSENELFKEQPEVAKQPMDRQAMSATVKKISPKFDQIFNEAFEAEQYNLHEISGIGYRKAYEFLIKDYVLRGKPKTEGDKIKNMGIADVVKHYIQDTHIKLIVQRVIWLGNDHAHYLPVFKNKTISDLKSLIYTTISWIEANEELLRIQRHAEKIEKQIPYRGKKPL